MAGIGFELKKLFEKKGVFALLKAYGYAGVITTGPMILGMALLVGIQAISKMAGLSLAKQDLLTCMMMYTLLVSMIVTNVCGMVVTRYTADCLYEDKQEKVIPSLYGSLTLMMILGGVIYGAFLFFSDIPFDYAILLFMILEELIVVWTQMNYLTAIKDYKGILGAFMLALFVGISFVYVCTCLLDFPVITTLLSCVAISYGMMIVWYHILLRKFFPNIKGSKVEFIRSFEKYPALIGCGFFMTIGLYGHLILMWGSDIGNHIHGLFYAAPQYDVPALMAFLSTLVTTINFVTSVEVNFYPKYRTYYSLFNDEGTLRDIEQAERELRTTLQDELAYNAAKQVFVTIVFIVLGTILLPKLPLGFNEHMLGVFRVLCLGYAFYAIGNSVMLMTLYFSDEKGAFWSTLTFAVTSVLATIVFEFLPVQYNGFGFVIGAACFMIVAIGRLWYYQRRISYYVLATQPMIQKVYHGPFTKIADYFMNRAEEKKWKKDEKE